MESQPMVSYRIGSTNSLLDKLAKLDSDSRLKELLDKLAKLGSASRLKELKQDLESLLEDLLLFGENPTDRLVKTWMKQAREVIYDVEDWVDLLSRNDVLELGGSDPMMACLLGTAEAIEIFKNRIRDARERCRRYNLLNRVPSSIPDLGPSKAYVDHKLLHLHREKPCLIPVDEAEQELIEHLTDDDEKLKVLSIVGTGGLGKTTLAKKIYKKLPETFESRAFIHIGRDLSIRGNLVDIYNQLKKAKGYKGPLCNDQQTSDDLWRFLGKKRYFIVLDDLWSIRVWKVISSALPDNNLGSRILITTDMSEVASSCSGHSNDFILQMEPLNEERSKSLFLSRISIPGEHLSVLLSQVTEILLKMCGGLPLAIIVAAGLITIKCAEFAQFGKSILPVLEQCTTQGMRKILNISYTDLSLPLKSCLLYLSTFPDSYIIKKDHLIWKWIAEGFIARRGEGLWDTGERYFHELISRRLIQPVFSKDNDELIGCTVHGVIRHFIVGLSKEENFFTWHEDIKYMPRDVVRRFSIYYKYQKDDVQLECISVHLSKVRSLALFWDVSGMTVISNFRFLRVLDLEDYYDLPNYHLLKIGGLRLLKYLRLACPSIRELPTDIEQAKDMETLDLRRSRVKALPSAIFRLRRLVCIYADGVELHGGTGNIQELEVVSTINGNSISSIDRMSEIMVKSKRLKTLGVRFADHSGNIIFEQSIVRFLDEIGKSNLQSLFLEGCGTGFLMLLGSRVPPRHLKKFELITRSERVPHAMASFISLTTLHITISELEAEGLRLLGDLPNLVVLTLSLEPTRAPVMTKEGARPRCLMVGFQSLQVFWIKYTDRNHLSVEGRRARRGRGRRAGRQGLGLQFAPYAMPKLRRLWLEFDAWDTVSSYGDFNFGLQHLTCLTQIDVTIWCLLSAEDAAKTAIIEQVSLLPNRPKLKFR